MKKVLYLCVTLNNVELSEEELHGAFAEEIPSKWIIDNLCVTDNRLWYKQ